MKTRYKAVCDAHKEMCNMFVHDTYRFTYVYLDDSAVTKWLNKHAGCALRLIHRDDELDKCFESGYIDHRVPPVKRLKKTGASQ